MNRKQRRAYLAEKPTAVDGQLASRTAFYREKLFSILKGCYEIKCPKEWGTEIKDYMLNNLLRSGYVILTDSSCGILPLFGSLREHNFINFPTAYTIALPRLGTIEGVFGVNGVLLFQEWVYSSYFYTAEKFIDIFAQRFASCDCGIDVNVFNSRMAYIAEAETKAQAQTIKAAYDEISEGNPLVVYKNDTIGNEGLKLFFNNLKNNYIANDMLDTKRSIMNEFLTMIGINNANTDKKERMLTGEVDSNNEELYVNIAHWNENLKQQSEQVRNVLGIEFDIKYKFVERTDNQQQNQQDNQEDNANNESGDDE